MTTATILCASLLCLGVCSAAQMPPVIACNVGAIRAEDRPRYKELVHKTRAAMHARRELRDGYSFKVRGTGVTLVELAEWITMERLCCPFLTIAISTSGAEPDWELTLTGSEGVKALIEAEFK
jgi:hypothetical protein